METGLFAQLAGLGAPLAFQNIIISVGGLVVQYVVNGYAFFLWPDLLRPINFTEYWNWRRFLRICDHYVRGPEPGAGIYPGSKPCKKRRGHGGFTALAIGLVMITEEEPYFLCSYREIPGRLSRCWISLITTCFLWQYFWWYCICCMYSAQQSRGWAIQLFPWPADRGIFHAGRRSHGAAPFHRPDRDFLCRDQRLERRGTASGSELLLADQKVLKCFIGS